MKMFNYCSICELQSPYRISPWMFVRSRGGVGGVDIGLMCMWVQRLDTSPLFIPFAIALTRHCALSAIAGVPYATFIRQVRLGPNIFMKIRVDMILEYVL